MATLYLMRGCPASGKSTLIKKLKAEEYTVSTDAIRLQIAGTEIVDGVEMISQSKNAAVFAIVHKELKKRMAKGEDIIFDATNISNLRDYFKHAEEFGYAVAVVDFNVELEELIRRNKTRGIAYVPEEVIKRMYNKKQSVKLAEGTCVFTPEEFEAVWNLHKNN